MKNPYLLPAALLLAPLAAVADPIADPIVVTATRTAQTADEALASVSVIERAEIERLQASSLSELLGRLPGVSVASRGGAGSLTSLHLRGANSDHTLVLVDGIKVGSVTTGMTAFQHIPVEAIERIEVVRGPRSSLYGSEPIGGVIQIFTRRGGGEVTPHLQLSAASHDTYSATLGLRGGGDDGWFSLLASGLDSGGFDACRGESLSAFGGCFADEPDRDGYREKSLSLRGGYRFDKAEVDLHWLRSDGHVEFDGFHNSADVVQQVAGLGLQLNPHAIWQSSLRAGRSQDRMTNFSDGSFGNRIDSERDSLSWQNDILLADRHLLTLGADYQVDRIDYRDGFGGRYAEDARDNHGLFGQLQLQAGAQQLQFSLRHDDNQQFGSHTTGGLQWGIDLERGVRLTAAYATAFKAPTFNQLYSPWGDGNLDLNPEHSRGIELGIGGKLAAGQANWSLNLYQNVIDDLIVGWPNPVHENVSEARIRGLEASFNRRIGDWRLATSLTLLDARDRSDGANHDNHLIRRAGESARIDLDRELGRYRVGATLFAEGRRYDDPANQRPLSAYGTMDLRAEYRITPAWRLQGRIANLFDQHYETAEFYNQPGRTLQLTLRYN